MGERQCLCFIRVSAGYRISRLMKLEHEAITEKIIGAAFEVYRVLGYGFLEKVYQRAMQVELLKQGLKAELEHPIKVSYKGAIVGEYQADIFVEDAVMVELKVARNYNPEDEPLWPDKSGVSTKGVLMKKTCDGKQSEFESVFRPCFIRG